MYSTVWYEPAPVQGVGGAAPVRHRVLGGRVRYGNGYGGQVYARLRVCGGWVAVRYGLDWTDSFTLRCGTEHAQALVNNHVYCGGTYHMMPVRSAYMSYRHMHVLYRISENMS